MPIRSSERTTPLTWGSQASVTISQPIAGDDVVNSGEQIAVDFSGTTSDVEDGQTVTLVVSGGLGWQPGAASPMIPSH